MTDRNPILLLLIGMLVAVAVYLNWDFFQSGYEHPPRVTELLTWQGEEEARGLELRRGLDLQGGLQVLLEVDREKT